MMSAGTPPPRPARTSDYLQLAKPGITALIVAVAVAGYFLADPPSVDPVALAGLCGFGALGSAGAGMLNHYVDRDIDRRMRRTADRPLPAERIAPETRVLVFGLALTALALAGAAVFVNVLTAVSIGLGSITYVVVYTVWLKRRTSWNIVIGGFAGSAPALAGGAAAVGSWSPGVLAFALLVFLWTPPHFWSLALLLREDYRRAGLPMLPRMDDPEYSGRVVVVSAALLVPATVLVLYAAPIVPVIGAVLLALALGFVGVTGPLLRDASRPRARRGFLYSGPYLLAVVVSLVVNWFLVGHPSPI